MPDLHTTAAAGSVPSHSIASSLLLAQHKGCGDPKTASPVPFACVLHNGKLLPTGHTAHLHFSGPFTPPPQVILACFFSPQTSFPLLHLAGDLAIDLVTGKIKAIRRASSHVPTTLQLFSTGQLGSPPPTAHGTPLQGTLAMPGDCSGCQAVTWRGRCSWHLVGGGQDAAQHPIVHGAGLTAERSSPNQCQWCWGCETHTAPPSGLPLDPGP